MIVAVLPALDEEQTVASVVRAASPYVNRVVVVDNGSVDRTAEQATRAGAVVVFEAQRGYGRACLAGVERARELGANVIVFLDADGSDDPEDLPRVLAPVLAGEADLALGVRSARWIEAGSMTHAQRFGNWLAPLLMRWTTGARYRDMPPQKVITRAAFDALEVRDKGHGFTIELLLEAHRHGLRTVEIDVHCYRRQAGKSKVSGTFWGTVRASTKVLTKIGRYALEGRARG